MKKSKLFILLICILVCAFGFNTYATSTSSTYASGKAVIPSFTQQANIDTNLNVSNITNAPINVTITLYNYDGTVITDDNDANAGKIRGTNLLNYDDQNTNTTASFTLNGHSTGVVNIYFYTSLNYGYGVIQWSQDSDNINGLVVQGSYLNRETTGETSRYGIPINNGMPF